MKKTQTYSLNSIKQLIDLNGDLTNFDLTFNVTSKDNSEFQVIVVDQNTLDNNANIEYKNAVGTISGNIIADKNVYQNYLLLLKAETPCDCEVTIEVKPIPPKIQVQQPVQQIVEPLTEDKFDWKSLLTIIAVIGFCCLVYFFFIRKKDTSTKSTKTDTVKETIEPAKLEVIRPEPIKFEPIRPEPIIIPELKVEVPILSTPPLVSSKPMNENLLSKLKNLPTISKKV
jgi:hypothetical protein